MLKVNATLCAWSTNIVPSIIASLYASWPYSEIRAVTSEELLELKSMFANPKHGPWHNGRTCVQCIPWMPAGEAPYQSLQLFWCVLQRPPCPPHRPGMCSLWACRLWERPAPPRCLAPPQSLQPPNEYWRLWSFQYNIKDLSLTALPVVPQKAWHHTTKPWRTTNSAIRGKMQRVTPQFFDLFSFCFSLCFTVLLWQSGYCNMFTGLLVSKSENREKICPRK